MEDHFDEGGRLRYWQRRALDAEESAVKSSERAETAEIRAGAAEAVLGIMKRRALDAEAHEEILRTEIHHAHAKLNEIVALLTPKKDDEA